MRAEHRQGDDPRLPEVTARSAQPHRCREIQQNTPFT
jgi:hypothetical protein